MLCFSFLYHSVNTCLTLTCCTFVPGAPSMVMNHHNCPSCTMAASHVCGTLMPPPLGSLLSRDISRISGTHLPSSPTMSYTLSIGSVLIGVCISPSSPAASPLRLSSRLRDMSPAPWGDFLPATRLETTALERRGKERRTRRRARVCVRRVRCSPPPASLHVSAS